MYVLRIHCVEHNIFVHNKIGNFSHFFAPFFSFITFCIRVRVHSQSIWGQHQTKLMGKKLPFALHFFYRLNFTEKIKPSTLGALICVSLLEYDPHKHSETHGMAAKMRTIKMKINKQAMDVYKFACTMRLKNITALANQFCVQRNYSKSSSIGTHTCTLFIFCIKTTKNAWNARAREKAMNK